jgi:hypothetical protein
VAKLVAEEWKDLSSEERAKWEDMAARDRERFELEKSFYTGPWKVSKIQKGRKDPNAPKKPPSAFLLFSNAMRSEVREANPGLATGKLSKILSQRWSETPEEERKLYFDQYNESMEKYRKEVTEYKQNARMAQKKREEEAMKAMAERASLKRHESFGSLPPFGPMMSTQNPSHQAIFQAHCTPPRLYPPRAAMQRVTMEDHAIRTEQNFYPNLGPLSRDAGTVQRLETSRDFATQLAQRDALIGLGIQSNAFLAAQRFAHAPQSWPSPLAAPGLAHAAQLSMSYSGLAQNDDPFMARMVEERMAPAYTHTAFAPEAVPFAAAGGQSFAGFQNPYLGMPQVTEHEMMQGNQQMMLQSQSLGSTQGDQQIFQNVPQEGRQMMVQNISLGMARDGRQLWYGRAQGARQQMMDVPTASGRGEDPRWQPVERITAPPADEEIPSPDTVRPL